MAYSSKARSRTTRRTRKMSKKNKRINDFYQVQKMNYSGRSVSLLGNRQSFYVHPNTHYGYLPSQRGRPERPRSSDPVILPELSSTERAGYTIISGIYRINSDLIRLGHHLEEHGLGKSIPGSPGIWFGR